MQPKQESDALTLGSLMHETLEVYYLARQAGTAQPDSVKSAEGFLQQKLTDTNDFITVGKCMALLGPYWDYAEVSDRDWEILEVEKKFEIPITADYVYVMKLDLLIRDHADSQKIKVVDHKSTYDFWSEDDFELNAQFPKYIGALRFNGIPVTGALVNQIRTRKLKEPTWDTIFRRTDVNYNEFSIRQALKEQIIASVEIMDYRNSPEPVRVNKALRIMNKYNCKGCGVRSLCTTEFKGQDTSVLMQTDYKRNEYDASYNPGEEVVAW